MIRLYKNKYQLSDVRFTLIVFLCCGGLMPTPVLGQESERRSASAVFIEEVLVTARKREESVQDVPLSISAFGSEQIDALKVRDLTSLAVGMPNVALDDLGTTRGTANFSIRGLGVNSSIPSIDPTVGVFVDGVYMGLNSGILFDTFDLASIEVLRGPQGILFGRNVTGGAVLLNTKKPSDEQEAKVRVAVDGGEQGGLNTYLMGSISGPLSNNFSARLTAYYNDDKGWHENLFDGSDHGAIEQMMLRPVLAWKTENAELVLRYEYMETEGDGPSAQSHTNGLGIPGVVVNFDRDSHDFSIDEKGFQDNETHFFTASLNWNVGFGDGAMTNIFGWRDYDARSLSDIDAQPVHIFHSPAWLEAEQYSNELRYNGTFASKANVTVGVYYFTNDLTYHERRSLLGLITPDGSPAITQDGGGQYSVDTYAVFSALDYEINAAWAVTVGLRYTQEKKEVDIASLSANVNALCNVVEDSCPFDFSDSEDWDSVSPKLGFIYSLSESARIYSHWARGFRSGGYNLRNAAQDTVNFGPGPFDQETVDNYEIGLKSEGVWGRVNAALFYNQIEDMQREINLADPAAGVVQLIRNTADADILGVEIDGTFILTDSLVALVSLGWLDPEYTDVVFDLNGDGDTNAQDKKLDLPRAAELTYSVGFTYDVALGDWGYMSSRINYAYRDDSAYTDNNQGFISDQKLLDTGIDFHTANERWVFSVYGKNLLDEVRHGGDTQLPGTLGPTSLGVSLGGTFSPLSKGRVIGLEITFNII